MNHTVKFLDLKPETALSHKKIEGMVVLCFENERPLKGMIGYLDWRLNGHFSTLLRQQTLTGKRGEAIYAPLFWNDQTFHFLVVGAGTLGDHGHRPGFSKTLFSDACKKIQELKLTRMGISALDWDLNSSLAGLPEDPNLWILN